MWVYPVPVLAITMIYFNLFWFGALEEAEIFLFPVYLITMKGELWVHKWTSIISEGPKTLQFSVMMTLASLFSRSDLIVA